MDILDVINNPLQALEASYLGVNISKSHLLLQYLARKTQDQSLIFYVTSLQPNLDKKAAFVYCIERNPSPPPFLLLIILSHATLWIPLCSSLSPQRNFLDFLSISSQSDQGSYVVCIA